ncbi:MAG: NAD(+) diphosphatase [Thermomicrobiales bacterium]
MRRIAGSVPPTFVPGVEPPEHAWSEAGSTPRGRCFAFVGGELLIAGSLDVSDTPGIPTWTDLQIWDLTAIRYQFLGLLDAEPCWSVELDPATAIPDVASLAGLRALHERVPESDYALAGRAAQIVAWERDHQFCSRCGTPTERMAGERARRCPDCNLTAYPRVTPAIITLIERGDRILLARGHAFLPGRYGIVAGFVEPGESLEDAVCREAREEVGLELANVEYFGSQPWPFPHGIMIGFRAAHAAGEIAIDDTEIAHADWFGLDDLPNIPAKLSIARKLIDDWAERHGAIIDQP